jgi:hypothetical protein
MDRLTRGGGTAILVSKCIVILLCRLETAAPEGYCHARSFGDQSSVTRGGLPLAHKTFDRVGPDHVTKRRIPRLGGGRN